MTPCAQGTRVGSKASIVFCEILTFTRIWGICSSLDTARPDGASPSFFRRNGRWHGDRRRWPSLRHFTTRHPSAQPGRKVPSHDCHAKERISAAFSGTDKKTLYVVGAGALGPDGKELRPSEGVRNNAKTIYRPC